MGEGGEGLGAAGSRRCQDGGEEEEKREGKEKVYAGNNGRAGLARGGGGGGDRGRIGAPKPAATICGEVDVGRQPFSRSVP